MKIYNILLVTILSVGLSGNATADLNNGLMAYYPFNGGANDESGHGNNGIVNGATLTTDRFGNSESAYAFDGIDDFIDLGNDSSLSPSNAVTLVAWYKTVSFVGTGNNSIIDKGYHSHEKPFYQYHLGVTGNKYSHSTASFIGSVSILEQNKWLQTGSDFWQVGSWYNLVLVYDGSEARYYVNGNLIDSEKVNGAMVDSGKNTYIGTFSNLSYFTPGVIDDVRIYNRSLSEQEVQQLYHLKENGQEMSCTELNIGTVSSNLDIHMPTLKYQSLLGVQNIWADLEYKGVDSEGQHIWGLKDFGVNQ